MKPYEIAETVLGKAGLGWVLENVVEVTRLAREKVGVNDILIYYWVLAPEIVHVAANERGPTIEKLKEVYEKGIECWKVLETPPAHPDHVSIVVFDEETKRLFTLRLTLEECRNTGMVN